MKAMTIILKEQDCSLRAEMCRLLDISGSIDAMTIVQHEQTVAGASQVHYMVIRVSDQHDGNLIKEVENFRYLLHDQQSGALLDQHCYDNLEVLLYFDGGIHTVRNYDRSLLVKIFEIIALSDNHSPGAVAHDNGSHDDVVRSSDAEVSVVHSEPRSLRQLSRREMEILKCIAQGQSNKIIAKNLNIVESTVKVHIKAILRKIPVENRTQAAIWALNHPNLVCETDSADQIKSASEGSLGAVC